MKQFSTGEYHGAKDLDRRLASRTGDGWEIQSITVTSSRPALGLLFGIIGFWLFAKHNVFHVTYVREVA